MFYCNFIKSEASRNEPSIMTTVLQRPPCRIRRWEGEFLCARRWLIIDSEFTKWYFFLHIHLDRMRSLIVIPLIFGISVTLFLQLLTEEWTISLSKNDQLFSDIPTTDLLSPDFTWLVFDQISHVSTSPQLFCHIRILSHRSNLDSNIECDSLWWRLNLDRLPNHWLICTYSYRLCSPVSVFYLTFHQSGRSQGARLGRRFIFLIDAALMILIEAALMRYMTKSFLRIIRNISLVALLYQLNELNSDNTFWSDCQERLCHRDPRAPFRLSTHQQIMQTPSVMTLLVRLRWIFASATVIFLGLPMLVTSTNESLPNKIAFSSMRGDRSPPPAPPPPLLPPPPSSYWAFISLEFHGRPISSPFTWRIINEPAKSVTMTKPERNSSGSSSPIASMINELFATAVSFNTCKRPLKSLLPMICFVQNRPVVLNSVMAQWKWFSYSIITKF